MSINLWICQIEVMCLWTCQSEVYVYIRGHVSDMSINSWICQSEVICLLIHGHVRVK